MEASVPVLFRKQDVVFFANDVKTKIQNLEAELANVQLNQQIKQDTNDIIHQFKDIKELDIVTVRNLINFIEVGGNKNNRIIKIHWNI